MSLFQKQLLTSFSPPLGSLFYIDGLEFETKTSAHLSVSTSQIIDLLFQSHSTYLHFPGWEEEPWNGDSWFFMQKTHFSLCTRGITVLSDYGSLVGCVYFWGMEWKVKLTHNSLFMLFLTPAITLFQIYDLRHGANAGIFKAWAGRVSAGCKQLYAALQLIYGAFMLNAISNIM